MYQRITIPSDCRGRNKRRLCNLYELTSGEADVALMLACGHTLQECASLRDVSLTTVRSHLQVIFSKTNTHRQGELIALLLAGPASLDVVCVSQDTDSTSAAAREWQSHDIVA